MAVYAPLRKLLDANDVEYETIEHREDFRARTTAADTGTPPVEFAKSVVVSLDGEYAFAVLPASHFLAPSRLAKAIGADEVTLASEDEMGELLPECELGAAPPFGTLFGLPTYVSSSLAEDERITFNAGTHRDAVRMTFADFERLEKPRIEQLSRHEEERP